MKILFVTLCILFGMLPVAAQVSGNQTYSPQNQGSKRNVQPMVSDGRPTVDRDHLFVDANILINVKAEEFVAMFGVTQEAATPAECSQKLDAKIADFSSRMKSLGINQADIFVDYTTQNRIYDFNLSKGIAKEKAAGFEAKRTVSVHYTKSDLFDQIVANASAAGVFDLVKVDYIVKDVSKIKNALLEAAQKVIKDKEARYGTLFGIKVGSRMQVDMEKYSVYYPAELYSTYTAYESGAVSYSADTQEARKSQTVFFNPLNADGFDTVINPVVLEPVIQFTVFLRVIYRVD
ncbi:MAG: SIMPL domain-containing protein [Acidobacteria bacterium]|nr:SIMPL domain-containing protein [Acidobacteriota bacterium]